MSTRPNILFFITHDTGRHLGGYGRGAQTPQIDRLAADGVRFQQCFCTAPQCSPSRASALTGLRPHRHGLVGLAHRGFRLHDDVATTPKLLAAAGYQTWLFGFQHESPDPGGSLGYQVVLPARRAEDLSTAVVDALGGELTEPFFAVVGFSETHRPFSSSGEAPLDEVVVPPYLPDHPATRRDFADFSVDLARVDTAVGQILDALEAKGLTDNTLVVFTTDHGVAFPGAKGTLFDPGVGIGCVMRGPGGFSGGRDLEALVQNTDYLPTFCELAGVAAPDGLDGRSLLPLVQGQVDRLRDEVLLEMTYHAAYDPLRGVRTATHKYIRSYEYRPFWFPPNVDDGLSKQLLAHDRRFHEVRPAEMLFDLQADPNERYNVVDEPAMTAVLADLRRRLDESMAATGDMLVKGTYDQRPGSVVTPPTWWQPETP